MVIWVIKIFFCTVFLYILLPLLNLVCFCEVHTIFVLYCAHLCINVPLVSLIFFKRCLVFPILLFSSVSFHCSLKKAFLSLLAVLWNSAFRWVYLSFPPLPFTSLLFSAICKAFSDNHFVFLHFFFLGMVLVTASCTMLWNSVHCSSGILLDLIPCIYSSLTLYNHKGFDLGRTWMAEWFPYFLQFKSEFCNKEFLSFFF